MVFSVCLSSLTVSVIYMGSITSVSLEYSSLSSSPYLTTFIVPDTNPAATAVPAPQVVKVIAAAIPPTTIPFRSRPQDRPPVFVVFS
jgi:hypothetical protein